MVPFASRGVRSRRPARIAAVNGTSSPCALVECAWGESTSSASRTSTISSAGTIQPGSRPLWLLDTPRRLAQMDFELLAGPERIECGWWDGDDAKRDYFVARTGDASLVWLYRQDDGWFMHGIFA